MRYDSDADTITMMLKSLRNNELAMSIVKSIAHTNRAIAKRIMRNSMHDNKLQHVFIVVTTELKEIRNAKSL